MAKKPKTPMNLPKAAKPRAKRAPGQVRTVKERQLDRARVVEMIRRGKTLTAIAIEMDCPVALVASDWKKIREETVLAVKDDLDGIRVQKLEELSAIKDEAWKAWERSKTDKTKLVETSNSSGGSVTETTEGQCGDPRFLLVVKQCVDMECDLQGVKPDQKATLPGEAISWDSLYRTAEEVARRVNPVTEQLRLMARSLTSPKPVTGEVIEGKIVTD